MTNRKKSTLWIPPLLYMSTITLTGGTLKDYGISRRNNESLSEIIMKTELSRTTGKLYPFDPNTRSKSAPDKENRGHYTKGGVWNSSPTFSIETYDNVGSFVIEQYVYTFDSEENAKKMFEYVKNEYSKQLKAYESMMTTYYSEKKERFDKKIKRKKDRKAKVDLDPKKVSKREEKLKELQKKASN